MADVVVAPAGDDEVELWVTLRNAVDPQLPVEAEGVRRQRRHPSAGHFLARVDGEPIGAGFAYEQGDLRGTDVAVAFFGVVVDRRRHGAGTALYHAVSGHARAIGKARLQVDLWEDEHDGRRFLEARGFAEVERFARVRLDLATVALPDVAPPAGIELVTLAGNAELAPSMYETAREAYADMPSADPIDVSYEDFHGWEVERPSLRGDLSFLAVADGEVVAFGTVDMHGDVAFNSLTAVRRAWRRRGVASAIKAAQIRAAKEAGLPGLTTFSERRNVPMRTLNRKLGYEPLPDQLRLRGPLA